MLVFEVTDKLKKVGAARRCEGGGEGDTIAERREKRRSKKNLSENKKLFSAKLL
jgi:hypothetical protein